MESSDFEVLVALRGEQFLKDFGEKVLINTLINIGLKFGVTARWYGRVRELVAWVEAESMIM